MHVENLLLEQRKALYCGRKLVIARSYLIALSASHLSYSLVLCDLERNLLESSYKCVDKDFSCFACSVFRVQLTQFQHDFKDVGALVVHGDHFSTSNKLLEVLLSEEEGTHEFDYAASSH